MVLGHAVADTCFWDERVGIGRCLWRVHQLEVLDRQYLVEACVCAGAIVPCHWAKEPPWPWINTAA